MSKVLVFLLVSLKRFLGRDRPTPSVQKQPDDLDHHPMTDGELGGAIAELLQRRDAGRQTEIVRRRWT